MEPNQNQKGNQKGNTNFKKKLNFGSCSDFVSSFCPIYVLLDLLDLLDMDPAGLQSGSDSRFSWIRKTRIQIFNPDLAPFFPDPENPDPDLARVPDPVPVRFYKIQRNIFFGFIG